MLSYWLITVCHFKVSDTLGAEARDFRKSEF